MKHIDAKFNLLEERIKELEHCLYITNSHNNTKKITNNTNNIADTSIKSIDDIMDNDLINNTTEEFYENTYKNVIFTDGACSKRDKTGIRNAGFSIYIKENTDIECLKNLKLYKKIKNINFHINTNTLSTNNPNQVMEFEVTNIRAEGYAILYVLVIFKLLLVDKCDINNSNDIINILNEHNLFPLTSFKDEIKISHNCKTKDILIVTDSEFWINVITKWSIGWFKKDIVLEKKNSDLVLYILYYYHSLLKNNINVDFQHVRGHADKKKPEFYTYFEAGNIEADKLAVKSKLCDNNLFHIDI